MADIPNDRNTKAQYAVNATGAGVFEYPGDVDWYRMQLKVGTNYDFTAVGKKAWHVGGEAVVGFNLYDRSGNLLEPGSDGPNSTEGFSFRAAYSGLYFFEVTQSWDDHSAETYKFHVGTDVGNDFVNSPELIAGKYFPNKLEYDFDSDMVQLRLERGKVYDLSMISGNDLSGARVTVYSAEHAALAQHYGFAGYVDQNLLDTAPGWAGQIGWDLLSGAADFRAPSTGTYYLEGTSYAGQYRLWAMQDTTSNPTWQPTTPTDNADVLSYGDSVDVIRGRAGDDIIYAGGGNDKVNGGDGADLILGGTGDDYVSGGKSLYDSEGGVWFQDRVYGGPGRDRIAGGFGSEDELWGNGGDDIFEFGSTYGRSLFSVQGYDAHKIMDFMKGSDKIDISSIDADLGKAGDQSFIKIEQGLDSYQPRTLEIYNFESSSSIYGHMTHNDAARGFEIQVTTNGPLTLGDFVL